MRAGDSTRDSPAFTLREEPEVPKRQYGNIESFMQKAKYEDIKELVPLYPQRTY